MQILNKRFSLTKESKLKTSNDNTRINSFKINDTTIYTSVIDNVVYFSFNLEVKFLKVDQFKEYLLNVVTDFASVQDIAALIIEELKEQAIKQDKINTIKGLITEYDFDVKQAGNKTNLYADNDLILEDIKYLNNQYGDLADFIYCDKLYNFLIK